MSRHPSPASVGLAIAVLAVGSVLAACSSTGTTASQPAATSDTALFSRSCHEVTSNSACS
jgi:hypothetical protein